MVKNNKNNGKLRIRIIIQNKYNDKNKYNGKE